MSVTVVYRSAADMNKAEYWYEEGPKMQERALKAEAEVERLKQMVKSITGELDEVIETNQYLEAELAKYKRAYAEICHQFNFGNESDYIAMYNYWLDWAEKEGEI
jgi:peptidoglycan hydrolase CwlO-like protein